jgi:hypothetical protein
MNSLPTIPLFPAGQIVATPGALALLEQANKSPLEFLSRPGALEFMLTYLWRKLATTPSQLRSMGESSGRSISYARNLTNMASRCPGSFTPISVRHRSKPVGPPLC